jgi:Flp pilus assembly CpaE family ATPase
MNTNVTKCIAISPDAELRNSVANELAGMPNFETVPGLQAAPSPELLVRFFQASPARIVFLDARQGAEALRVSAEMELQDPGIQFIAVGDPPDPNLPWRGIQERLSLPLDGYQLRAAVERRRKVLEKMPRQYRHPTAFFSFLPAKAGAGASTLASAMARAISSTRKTLLVDLDLSSGTLGFRHRVEKKYSMVEVLESGQQLDEELWSQIVSTSNDLHIVPSSPATGAKLHEERLYDWMTFVRNIYDVVVFDLSGNMESYTFDVLGTSRSIFLVTTQEPECLHLGRAKVDALHRGGFRDQSCVLLNRLTKGQALHRAEVSDLLGLPVKAEFPNDYKSVQESVMSGGALPSGSPLSKAIHASLPKLTDAPAREPQKRHKFLEFSTLPVFSYWRQQEMRSERWE